MLKIKSLLAVVVMLIGITACVPANAQVNIFTDHTIVSMLYHGVNANVNVPFPTGKHPYIGRLGVEYKYKYAAVQMGYIHRSNVDLQGNEYFYDGAFVGIRYEHCVFGC